MKKLVLLALIFAFASGCGMTRKNTLSKEVIGYYAAWHMNSEKPRITPDKVALGKMTMLNYAFFCPTPDGKLVGLDSVADKIVLDGEPIAGKAENYKKRKPLVKMAHEKKIKVVVSIGGWADSENFPAIAADMQLTKTFANSAMNLLRKYDFDGLDIDWEYPGYKPHNGMPEDTQNFTRFLQVLRDSLDAEGAKNKRKYLLTAALPAGHEHIELLEVGKIGSILNMLNLMTYDFTGDWDSISNHNSPLYAGSKGDSLYNTDAAFRIYHEKYGVPAEKINIGVAFYGKSFANCSDMYQPHTGSDRQNWRGTSFYRVEEQKNGFTRMWDEKAQSPYLVNKELKSVLTYDDEESVGLAADYVKKKNGAGVIIWEVTGDHLQNGKTPLLDVLNKKFGEK